MVPQSRFHSGEARGVGRCRNRGGKLTRRVHASGLGGGVHLTTWLFAAIVRGEAEIAIQRISELLPVKQIDLMDELPAAVQRITIYAAGVTVGSQQPEAGRALIEFLTRAEHSPCYGKTVWNPSCDIDHADK